MTWSAADVHLLALIAVESTPGNVPLVGLASDRVRNPKRDCWGGRPSEPRQGCLSAETHCRRPVIKVWQEAW
jgi:hypothetical protein